MKRARWGMALASVLLLLCLAGCGGPRLEFEEAGSVQPPEGAGLLLMGAHWYLCGQSSPPTDGEAAGEIRIYQASTDSGARIEETVLQTNEVVTDVVYADITHFFCLADTETQPGKVRYRICDFIQEEAVTRLKGTAGEYLSQMPRFFFAEGGVYLLLQDEEKGVMLYTIPRHADDFTPMEIDLEGTLIAVDPKPDGGRFACFAEQAGKAWFVVSELDREAMASRTLYKIPLEEGAGLIDYALTGERLVICQQTAASRLQNAPPQYELLVWDLPGQKILWRKEMGTDLLYELTPLEEGVLLCRDSSGALRCLAVDKKLEARPVSLPGGQTKASIHLSYSDFWSYTGVREGVYLVDEETGRRYRCRLKGREDPATVPTPVVPPPGGREPCDYPEQEPRAVFYPHESGWLIMEFFSWPLDPDFTNVKLTGQYTPPGKEGEGATDNLSFSFCYGEEGEKDRFGVDARFDRQTGKLVLVYCYKYTRSGTLYIMGDLPAQPIDRFTDEYLYGLAEKVFAYMVRESPPYEKGADSVVREPAPLP